MSKYIAGRSYIGYKNEGEKIGTGLVDSITYPGPYELFFR